MMEEHQMPKAIYVIKKQESILVQRGNPTASRIGTLYLDYLAKWQSKGVE